MCVCVGGGGGEPVCVPVTGTHAKACLSVFVFGVCWGEGGLCTCNL